MFYHLIRFSRQESDLVHVNDVLDLNNSDLIACTVIMKEGKLKRFLVIGRSWSSSSFSLPSSYSSSASISFHLFPFPRCGRGDSGGAGHKAFGLGNGNICRSASRHRGRAGQRGHAESLRHCSQVGLLVWVQFKFNSNYDADWIVD